MLTVANIVIVLLILLIGYWWANQGPLSAFLHLLCVITAGALALALWEPLTVGLLLRGGGFDPYAWGVCLLGVFLIALFGLRLATDKLVPANLNFPPWTKPVVGFPIGVVSGVLTLGITITGAGFLQSQNSLAGIVGHARADDGRIEHRRGLWLPVHQWTTEFYSLLSVGAFSSGRPLRHYRPELHQQALSLIRDTYKDGRGQITLRPSQADVTAAFVCPNRAVVEVRFRRGALDYNSQLTVSAAQLRLISAAGGFDEPYVAFPERWRQQTMDAGMQTFRFDDVSHYITSVPGRDNAEVRIEFPWPQGVPPRFVEIKGTRFELPRVQQLPSCDEVFAAGLGGASAPTAADFAGAQPIPPGDVRVSNDIRPVTTSVNVLPGTMDHRDRYLTEGVAEFTPGREFYSRQLQILGIYELPRTRVVQLDVSRGHAADIYGPARDRVTGRAEPKLVDSSGNTYTAIGYIHEKGVSGTEIRLAPDRGMNLETLPHLPTAGNQTLRLIFRVTEGITIVAFRLGDVTLGTCSVSVPARS